MEWFIYLCLMVFNGIPLRGTAYTIKGNYKDESTLTFPNSETGAQNTLVVPRSNKIQIAFADDGSDPRTKLHMDLLRLYRQVMEEVLERNKLISTVQTLLDKMSQMDEISTRVHRLEQDLGIIRTSGDGSSGHRVHHGNQNEGEIRDSSRGVVHEWDENNKEEYQGTTTSFSEDEYGVTSATEAELSSMRTRIHQQEKTIRRLQEDLRIQSKLSAEQGREVERQNEQIERLRTSVDKLHLVSGTGTGDTSRITADEVENHSSQLEVLRAELGTMETKLHKLTLDHQWHDFKLNMQQNSTDNLEKEFQGIENTVSTLYTQSGSTQTTVNQVRADNLQCKSRVSTLNRKVSNIEEHIGKIAIVLSKPSNRSNTQVSNHASGEFVENGGHSHELELSSNVFGLIEDATSKVYRMVHRLNSSQHQLISNDRRQQMQLDEISLSVESLRDEVDDYFNKLKDLDNQAASLRDGNKNGKRDRDKIKKKLERIQRDMNVVMSALNAYGMTTEPSTAGRRTTQSHTLVTRDATVPELRPSVTPSTSGHPDGKGKPDDERETTHNHLIGEPDEDNVIDIPDDKATMKPPTRFPDKGGEFYFI